MLILTRKAPQEYDVQDARVSWVHGCTPRALCHFVRAYRNDLPHVIQGAR